ncbi:antirepressor [Gordonia phage Ruthy]|uniref:Antirepressor n=1 Tax=Gordonia phage Ruthy TaxID=2250323 RepID=A0A345L5F7_9CAUD|nr:antirepressor KilAC domain-containing protein [Gordonia phage Ruthy]AXH50509.1 antirepressor [Gordonia phage Ruthy]
MQHEHSQLTQVSGASPFDAIRNYTPEGREYWSARELMPLLGYSVWRDFANAIHRARVACSNSGTDPVHHFAGARKVAPSGPAAENYHLSRYACYLVALNGDPRKTEIAAAQTYFVIKTREAETGSTAPAIPQTYAAALRAAADEADRADRAEAQVRELEPRAEVADKLLTAEGDLSVADAAKSLTRAGVKVGQNRLFNLLDREYGWIYRASDGRWRVRQSAIETGWMSVIPQSHYHPKTGVLVLDPPQPRVTPKGLQRILSDHSRGDAA